ncbi:MAG: hypothetical protein JXR97_16825 [Planctomycetes bacterium]|nr:hypothetical protein [Planctomycetota bacterium]
MQPHEQLTFEKALSYIGKDRAVLEADLGKCGSYETILNVIPDASPEEQNEFLLKTPVSIFHYGRIEFMANGAGTVISIRDSYNGKERFFVRIAIPACMKEKI